ncbi:MAG: FecR family protein, partial [SAR324 cluster bacterium]|nr:FecR family protein [SAR324 cluster bacterium]
SLAHAQEGVLQIERGFAKITRGAKVRILRELGTPIALTLVDRVQVGTNSKATVWIRDGEETVQLASRSYFSLDNISAEQTTISMPTGKAQFKVTRKLGKLGGKQLGSKAKFQIRTVTAIVAVRGTEFVLGSESGQTSLLTLSGEVAMASAEAPEVEVVVLENQASTVQRGLAPTAPVSVPPEVQKEITQSDSSSSFKAVSFPPAVPIEQARQQKKREEEKKKAEKKEEKKDSKQKAPGKKDSGEQPAEKQEPKKPASGGTTEEKRPAPAPVPKNLPRLDNLPQLPGDLDQILENIQQENNRVRKKVIRLKLKRK